MPDSVKVPPLELDLDDLGEPVSEVRPLGHAEPSSEVQPVADVAPASDLLVEPVSEIRPVPAAGRRLVVDSGLRGRGVESAWITVSDEAGCVLYFEGTPSADGCVEVSFELSPQVRRVRVLLETARSHRQATVTLGDGWTSHSFS
jgi:hypothetical protein